MIITRPRKKPKPHLPMTPKTRLMKNVQKRFYRGIFLRVPGGAQLLSPLQPQRVPSRGPRPAEVGAQRVPDVQYFGRGNRRAGGLYGRAG